MPIHKQSTVSREIPKKAFSGWFVLVVHLVLIVASIALFFYSAPRQEVVGILLAFLGFALAFLALFGYFTLQPNEARVQILFGSYKGTVRDAGFHWANPFYSKSRGAVAHTESQQKALARASGDLKEMLQASAAARADRSTKLSLRAHNFNSETLKVNDKRGNPVEIAAVVVWRVDDTAMAVFDVEDYKSYVQVQSESALRGIASRFAYDHGEQHEPTLRDSADDVAHALTEELQVRLAKAGVIVEEARLTHLAYAPEIASVMLRRQQAEAIVSARQQIVQGAVSMVHMALRELEANKVVQLDPERKAAMVSNLLVVLCGNADATPVINTGTLYS
jgi:regulator of protease activity HflC (stomatin/prohibitin superfamily)